MVNATVTATALPRRMRLAAFLTIMLAFSTPTTGAFASVAPTRKVIAPVAAKSETTAGLRGPMSPERDRSAKALSVKALSLSSPGPPAAGLVATSMIDDPGQCRLACAHSYYFCLAGENAEACPGNWTQCLTTCGRPRAQP
jgi:hypothetical protein